jgi:nitrite reductase/ring-hydroxylating ferredoxin subunit
MQIRVALLSELAPGKGKVVEVEGRRITVYNLGGRLVATSTRAPHAHEPETGCAQHGLAFDAFTEDSPARLRTDGECRVWLDGDDVWMSVA